MPRSCRGARRCAACKRSVAAVSVDGRGGDRAIWFRCPDGVLHVFVCAVSRNGGPAEGPADYVVHAVRALVCQGMSLGLVLETLDRGFAHFYGGQGAFATAFLATVGEGAITYASAGHPDALLFDQTYAHDHLAATGHVLGVFSTPRIPQRTVRCAPGSTLVVSTNGILKARFGTAGAIGHGGLARMVGLALHAGCGDPADHVLSEVRKRSKTVSDDCALLVAHV